MLAGDEQFIKLEQPTNVLAVQLVRFVQFLNPDKDFIPWI